MSFAECVVNRPKVCGTYWRGVGRANRIDDRIVDKEQKRVVLGWVTAK